MGGRATSTIVAEAPLLVVPHGPGIGDLINARPLLAAIAAHYRERTIQVLAPAALSWLLPTDMRPTLPLAGVHLWERPSVHHPLASLGNHVSVRTTGPIVRLMPVRALAGGLTAYLRIRGYTDIISLLDRFHRLQLDKRWTVGPWNLERRHLIDLLADDLERDAIAVPCRRPQLPSEGVLAGARPDVLLAPNAGSTLKELPVAFWVSLTHMLIAQGRRIWVVAAPGRDTAVRIVRQAPEARLARTADLRHLAGWISGARLVVAPDTGILHMAAALGTPYVGLFGATDPIFLGPYPGTSGEIVFTSTAHERVCRRCWTGQLLPAVRCPLYGEGSCLAGIEPAEVMAAIAAIRVA